MPCKPISPKLKRLSLFLLICMVDVDAQRHSGLGSRSVIGYMAQHNGSHAKLGHAGQGRPFEDRDRSNAASPKRP